jgi:ABC-2 type transport system permease protein
VRQALTIAWRDLRAMYLSAFGIGCTAAFAALAGVLLVLDLRAGQARLDGWFAPLFVAVGVLAALVTMRSFAEEERAGSLELLLTAPVRTGTVVAGKLLAGAGVLVAVAAATIACPVLVAAMGHPDFGPIVTGYVGLALLGLAFVAVGLAVSAATSNPLAAAAGTTALLLGLWAGGLVAGGLTGRPRAVLDYLAPSSHVVGFLRGTLAVTDVAYFGSLTVVAVLATLAVLRARR